MRHKYYVIKIIIRIIIRSAHSVIGLWRFWSLANKLSFGEKEPSLIKEQAWKLPSTHWKNHPKWLQATKKCWFFLMSKNLHYFETLAASSPSFQPHVIGVEAGLKRFPAERAGWHTDNLQTHRLTWHEVIILPRSRRQHLTSSVPSPLVPSGLRFCGTRSDRNNPALGAADPLE